ncbi:MAG TPA: TIGR03435 family protein [Woeseiaceae bacterium]
MRPLTPTIALLCALTVVGAAQQSSRSPAFEVASIKPWQPPATRATSATVVAAPVGSGIFNRSTTAARLIAEAYEVQDFQLSGGQDWVRSERYDVAARAGREVSQMELRDMVKTLLADRFNLRVRTETREMPILELRRARSDGRLGPNLHDCSKGKRVPETPFRAPTGGAVAVSDCADGVRYLATIASRHLQMTVVDKTGLSGQWWFYVYYASELPRIPGVDLSQEKINPDLPSFEGALPEQLGLRLERTRGPVPVVVIESIERPTPN